MAMQPSIHKAMHQGHGGDVYRMNEQKKARIRSKLWKGFL